MRRRSNRLGHNRGRHGNTLIEFTLVGIPLVFVLISIFEISRGMWVYNTLAHAVREGVRYAIVNGPNCRSSSNWCVQPTGSTNGSTTIGDVAIRIRTQGTGMDPNLLRLEMKWASNTQVSIIAPENTLAALTSNGTLFPPSTSVMRIDDVWITGKYPFRSALAMFWPGAAPVRFQPVIWMSADSRDKIQF